jgi:hypothetical protein
MKKVLSTVAALGFCLYLPVAAIAGGPMDTSNDAILRELQELRAQVASQQAEIDMLKEQKVAAPAEQKPMDTLEAKNWVSALKKKVDVTLYGQVSKAVMFADDGQDDDIFFVDNAVSGTRLGVMAKSKLNDEFAVGGQLEFEWTQNNSNKVNMDNDNFDGDDAKHRQMRVYGQSKSAGKLTLGHGSVAADGIAQIDLSGTSLANGRADAAFGAGFDFYDTVSNSYSGVTVGKIFTDLDGGRLDGLVYDSPAFFGVTLSGTVAEGDYNDVAVRYDQKFGDTHVMAGIAMTQVARSFAGHKLAGSASVMLPMGLNFTASAGQDQFVDSSFVDGTYWFGKVGYQMKALSYGSTSFAVDYGQYDDIIGASSLDTQYDGDLWGAEMVQKLDAINTEVYLAYRLYELDDNVNNTDYDNVAVLLSGARFSF